MIADVRVDEKRLPGSAGRNLILVSLAALLLFVHWGLSGFNPAPYGTLPVEGSEVELFAPAGGSPLLIFGVTALLVFARRVRLERALGQPALWALGGPLLVGAGMIERWADYTSTPELLIPCLILSLLGTGAVLGGSHGLRAIAVPALFLVFAIPIPAGAVNLLVWPLQLSTAASTHTVLRSLGFASECWGDVVVLGDHAFQVIETCSGMRTIETLVMAAALYSILFYRRPTQVIAILLIAPICGYFVNLVRVLSIVFNPYSEWGALHTVQGIVMLVVGVLLIAGFDKLVQRLEAVIAPLPRQLRRDLVPRQRVAPLRPLTLGLFLGVMAMGNLAIPPWQPPTELEAVRLPSELAGSKPRGLKLDRQFLGSVGVANWLNREYSFAGSEVQVQILADDRLDRRGSLLSPKTAIPGSGYIELSHDFVSLADGGSIDRTLFAGRTQRRLVYHWVEGRDGVFEELWRNALALDRGPTRRHSRVLAVRLSTAVGQGDDALAEADARLHGFSAVVRDALN